MTEQKKPSNTNADHAKATPAKIEWRDDGQPVSRAFDDFYFCTTSGLEESRHIFLDQNHLPERWEKLDENSRFTIGETGFGTGLNFLAAWQQWKQTAPASAHLHFISVEKYPLLPQDLARALDLWPQLQDLSARLLEQYPTHLAPGIHRLNFDGNVHLTLIIDEASCGLERLLLDSPQRDRLVDAWFLDGFAPAKNPDMWSQALFRSIARLSAPLATFATFASASNVRRGLEAVGFTLQKTPGFGLKREMLHGQFLPVPDPAEHTYSTTPWHLPNAPGHGSQTVAVVGAGVAGACVARALAERNFNVTVFEQGPEPGSGASGNDQGILYAKLSPKPGPNGDFNLLALQFAQRFYPAVCPEAVRFNGLIQLAQTEKEQQLQQQIVDQLSLTATSPLAQPLSAQQASELAGVSLSASGLHFPRAGWLRPRQVCAALLQHPNIHTQFATRVSHTEQINGQWQLTLAEEAEAPRTQVFDALVLCAANFNRKFTETALLPLKPIRGQVSFAQATPESERLKIALCGEGYIAPAAHSVTAQGEKQHSFGATFKLKQTDTDIRAEEHRENLETLASLLPDVARTFAHQTLKGRAALRAATPDYLPMAGPLADWHCLESTYGGLRKNRKQLINRRTPYQPNVYVLAGLGSRGFTYAPLAAEVLAAWISGEVMPVSQDLVKALHPMRFAIRALGKNREI